MIAIATLVTWSCIAVVLYTYLGYPLVIFLAARWFGRATCRDGPRPTDAAVVMAVRGEAHRIERRIVELAGHLRDADVPGRIVVAVNGGDDNATLRAARDLDPASIGPTRLTVIQTDPAGGKALAVSEAVRQCDEPVVILADARQRWGSGAIARLIDAMTDPQVAGVSGELVLEQSPGVMAGVGAYWRYEKWIRRNESRYGCQIGVTGAIAAVRRDWFVPIPPGTILDDVFWPLQIALRGGRVVMIDDAIAYDQLPDTAAGELRRKVRTLAGNFQLVAIQPKLLLPLVNPVWGRFVSHKLLRLACPWAILGITLGGLIMGGVGWLFSAAAITVVSIGIVGLSSHFGRHQKLFSAAGSFVLLNWAAVLAAWAVVTRRTDRLW